MIKYLLAWVPLVPIAIANGALRELVYGPHLGELAAHQVSTGIGILLFGVYIGALMRRWPPASGRQAVAVGLAWLAMTVAFEFLFGHYVAGHPWSRLLHDYDLSAGRVWLLVPAFVAVAPYAFWRLQKDIKAPRPTGR